MTNKDAIALAVELKNKHDELRYWTVALNSRKRSFGLCSYSKCEIQLSSAMIPYMTDEAIKDTIIHEIAHALTQGHGHDYVWKIKCIKLGGNGNRCGNTENFNDGKSGLIEFCKKESKYTLTCPVCGHQCFRNRIPKRSCSCGQHGGGYNEMFKMVVTQNY